MKKKSKHSESFVRLVPNAKTSIRTKCYVACHTIRLVIARARKLKTPSPLSDLFKSDALKYTN